MYYKLCDPSRKPVLGWLESPYLKFDPMSTTYNGDTQTIGLRLTAKSTNVIDMLYHEIGHMIVAAMDDELWRLERDQYGLHVPEKNILGHMCFEPPPEKSGNITILECRVIAIEIIIRKSLGLPCDFDFYREMADTLRYLPDWWTHSPKRFERRYEDRDDRRTMRCVTKIVKYEQYYDLNTIKSLWQVVIDRLKNLSERIDNAVAA